MKKVIFGLIATIMLSNVSFGQNIKDLGNDKDFQKYIIQSIKFSKNINKEVFNKVFNDQKIDENELDNMYKVFNFKNKDDYNNFLLNQDKQLNSLKVKYSFEKYDKEELTNYINDGIIIIIDNPSNPDVYVTTSSNCHRKYRNDVAIIGASAVIGHIGCATLDLAVVPGLICHAAVLTIQAAAMDNANIELENCLKN